MGSPGDARDRLTPFGDEMIRIHDWLRGELGRLGDEVDAHLFGRGERPRNLRAHCLSFCAAVTKHHRGEDAGAFPLLVEEFPELRPLVEKMAQDHVMVSGLLESLRRVVDDVPAEPDEATARRIQGELGGLNAILESHFSFEERRIVDALNSLPADSGTTESLFGVEPPPTR